MYDTNFQLEFKGGRFPFRFCLIAVLLTTVTTLFYYAGSPALFNLTHVFSIAGMVILFCVVSLGVLYGAHNILAKLSFRKGIITCWFLVVLIAILISLAMVFAKALQNFGIGLIDTNYFTPGMGYTLIASAIIFTPILLWLEKKLYSDKISQMAIDSEQYTNLDFRIRPHFLFNSLNSVAGLITQNPARAETALYNLADVFRAVMSDKRQLVPLKAELDMADKYLYLEKIRLGDRLKISSKIDPNSVGVKVPVFLLQPMLENAVYHGIETRFQGGKISLTIKVAGKHLIIKISNPLPEAGVQRRVGNKVAQKNLRQRIDTVFGSRASLDSYEAETTFNVIAKIPL